MWITFNTNELGRELNIETGGRDALPQRSPEREKRSPGTVGSWEIGALNAPRPASAVVPAIGISTRSKPTFFLASSGFKAPYFTENSM
jgi:hypothetical protein